MGKETTSQPAPHPMAAQLLGIWVISPLIVYDWRWHSYKHLTSEYKWLFSDFFSLGKWPQSGIIRSKITDRDTARRKLDLATLPGEGTSHFPETLRWGCWPLKQVREWKESPALNLQGNTGRQLWLREVSSGPGVQCLATTGNFPRKWCLA